MRDLKFRCFYRGKMYEVKELQGSYVGLIEMEINGELWPVSPDSEHVKGIMQFTGLLDKNGKEIYSEDIMKHPEFSGLVKVNWAENGYWTLSGWCFERTNPCLGEVIGNVFETPELL